MSNEYNSSVLRIDMPSRVKALPVSEKGFPVPWFVAWIDGKPDFRVVDPEKVYKAYTQKRCWICGDQIGVYKTLAIGPMCALTRTTSEPASHKDCAIFAAKACPFLVNPKMRRNGNDVPDGASCPGIHLDRNPGVIALWTTREEIRHMRVENGILFRFGDPEDVLWFAEGRMATRAEVDFSIAGGLPFLESLAMQDGADAIKELANIVEAGKKYLPV